MTGLYQTVLDASTAAFRAYRPSGGLRGPVHLLRAADGYPDHPVDGYTDDRGWDAVVVDLHLGDAAGNHFELLQEEHAPALAEQIRDIVASYSSHTHPTDGGGLDMNSLKAAFETECAVKLVPGEHPYTDPDVAELLDLCLRLPVGDGIGEENRVAVGRIIVDPVDVVRYNLAYAPTKVEDPKLAEQILRVAASEKAMAYWRDALNSDSLRFAGHRPIS